MVNDFGIVIADEDILRQTIWMHRALKALRAVYSEFALAQLDIFCTVSRDFSTQVLSRTKSAVLYRESESLQP